MDEAAIQRLVAQAIRGSRNDALDMAIEICEELAKTGHSAACCAQSLRNIKAKMPEPPEGQN